MLQIRLIVNLCRLYVDLMKLFPDFALLFASFPAKMRDKLPKKSGQVMRPLR